MFNGIHTMGAGDWAFMGIFWFAFIAAIVYIAMRLFPTRSEDRGKPDQPRQILESRLARGEIDVETYEQLRTKLGPPSLAERG